MTKQQLIDENARLTRELANAIAANQAALAQLKAQTGAGTYTVAGRLTVPFTLTDEQQEAVRDDVEEALSRQCPNGYFDGVKDEPIEVEGNGLPYEYYLARYSCDKEDGTTLYRFWGLKPI